jgi:hypothetical protein
MVTIKADASALMKADRERLHAALKATMESLELEYELKVIGDAARHGKIEHGRSASYL